MPSLLLSHVTYILGDILCLCSRTGTASTTMNKKKGKLAIGLHQKWILFIRMVMFCYLMNATTVYIVSSKSDINAEHIEGLFCFGGFFLLKVIFKYTVIYHNSPI